MRRLAAFLVPMAALVAGLLGPASAEAVDNALETLQPWPAAPCATGAMTAEPRPERVVWATGWIEPCPGTPASAEHRFAVVYFGPVMGLPGRPLRYTNPVGRTEFASQLDTKQLGLRAACLAYSPTGLLSCVSIDAGNDPDRLVVTPIPTDDPRVTLPVFSLMTPDPYGDGYCGTCL